MAKTFGQTLKSQRLATGYTLSEVANKAHVSVSYLCDIENGRRKPPPPDCLGRILDSVDDPGSVWSPNSLILLAAEERGETESLLLKQAYAKIKDLEERNQKLRKELREAYAGEPLTETMIDVIMENFEG